MKKYNINNYLRYKNDLKDSIKKDETILTKDLNRDQLVVRFLPLVENIARKFATSEQASGVLSINDLIQEGSIGLCRAVDRIDWSKITESEVPEKMLKSFLSKRVKGSIRRAIDINRGSIRIPEHKLNEIRKDNGKSKKLLALFFNSMFLSLDERIDYDDEDSPLYEVADTSDPYIMDKVNEFLREVCTKHLSTRQTKVLDMSYGLWGEKYAATAIAEAIGIVGASAYVRVSEIKKKAITILTEEVNPQQIFNFI